MDKKVLFGISCAISVSLVTGVLFFSSANSSLVFGIRAADNITWYHYPQVDPTEEMHGSKEFWASSEDGCQTHTLTNPGKDSYVERDFSTYDSFEALSMTDDRYILPIFDSGNEVTLEQWDAAFDVENILTNGNFKVEIESINIMNSSVLMKSSLANEIESGKMNNLQSIQSEYSSWSGEYYITDFGFDPFSGRSTYRSGNTDSWNGWSDLHYDSIYDFFADFGMFYPYELSDFDYSNGIYISNNQFHALKVEESSYNPIDNAVYKDCYIVFDGKNPQYILFELALQQSGMSYSSIVEMKFSNYGTTSVTLPDID